jgi:spermidine/putrescine transport system substrate-binding protein
MKKAFLIMTIAISALLLSCGNGKPKLFIYNWTYYMPDDVLRDFEKQFNVEIVYDVYPSNEDMFTKLKSGASGYDIVVPSGDYVSIMIKENMLLPMDLSKIPNFKNIDTAVIGRIAFDKGNKFSVPYMMGGSGIAVNKTHVKDYDKSWNIFSRTDLKNRMTMLDDMREVLGGALRTLGYSVNSTSPEELEKAKQVVLGWKANLCKFDAEAFAKGFAAGEFWVVQGYAENVMREYDSTKLSEVDFFIPKEGGSAYIDNLVILKDAKHKDLAYTFINFIHDPKIFARIIDYLRYPCINTAARQFVTKKSNYELSDLAKSELKEDLGPALELYNKIWQEIRVGR